MDDVLHLVECSKEDRRRVHEMGEPANSVWQAIECAGRYPFKVSEHDRKGRGCAELAGKRHISNEQCTSISIENVHSFS